LKTPVVCSFPGSSCCTFTDLHFRSSKDAIRRQVIAIIVGSQITKGQQDGLTGIDKGLISSGISPLTAWPLASILCKMATGTSADGCIYLSCSSVHDL
jgi:hypothetical protein